MLYVGANLPAVAEWTGVEPALIDPALPRDDRRPDHAGEGMTYWPAYATNPPSCRAAYLDWLEAGRSDPNAYIGYVFLYFYGLERRALHDARDYPEARSDVPAIELETRRLLSIYSQSGSFRRYASEFLDILHARRGAAAVGPLPPSTPSTGGHVPFLLRMGLANLALKGASLPPDWALAWARSDPEIRCRTPAARCPDEFEELFRQRYSAQHGEGIRLKPYK